MLLDLLGIKSKVKTSIKTFIHEKTDKYIVQRYVTAPICQDNLQDLANTTIDTATGTAVDVICISIPL